MIKPTDIVTHLQEFLPAFTDLFSSKITATATVSGNTVTVTSVAHGFLVGERLVIGGGNFTNDLASVVDNGDGTLRFETTDEHDLTEPKAVNDPTQLVLDGIGSPWDGAHTITSIPNRKHFEIAFPVGETVPPVIATGVLVEDRAAGIIGAQTVATVPDADTFTFIASNVPIFPTGTVQNLTVVGSIRIGGAADIFRAEAMYTKQAPNEAWLFVIMNDADVSKDRNTLNDGVATYTSQNFGKQTILQDFTTVVFLPTENDTTGFDAQSLAFDEIYRALVSALLGHFFPDSDTAERYVTVSNGHAPGRYNSAYYLHVYDWQSPTVITFDNGFLLEPDVAFRDIMSVWDNNSDEEAQLDLNIDLDEETL